MTSNLSTLWTPITDHFASKINPLSSTVYTKAKQRTEIFLFRSLHSFLPSPCPNGLFLFLIIREQNLFLLRSFKAYFPPTLGIIFFAHFELARHRTVLPYLSKDCQKNYMNLKQIKETSGQVFFFSAVLGLAFYLLM